MRARSVGKVRGHLCGNLVGNGRGNTGNKSQKRVFVRGQNRRFRRDGLLGDIGSKGIGQHRFPRPLLHLPYCIELGQQLLLDRKADGLSTLPFLAIPTGADCV